VSRGTALVIGGRGALGALVADELGRDGWRVRRGTRSPSRDGDDVAVDFDQPYTLRPALKDVDLVVNCVPDEALAVERMVLARGGLVLNVSALPDAPGRRLREQASGGRGTVVMNAGIAPGVTNLVAADLLRLHPEADAVEMVFTVSAFGTNGPSGMRFAHRGLAGRHRTMRVPLPSPFGQRTCIGFAERDRGWLSDADRVKVETFLCVREGRIHCAMVAANAAGVLRLLPPPAPWLRPPAVSRAPSREPIAHWVAVRRGRERLAARTVRCRGDYVAAAASTRVFADVLLARGDLAGGVYGPEDALALDDVAPALAAFGIEVVDEGAAGAAERQLAAAHER